MASKTFYQNQADKRTKTALKLRARFDAKVRKYATALVAALAGAGDAKARLDRLNALYGVDLSPETLLVHALRTANVGGSLTSTLAGSAPGEERQLFNATVDGNGGAVLAPEAVFGEVAGPVGSGGGPVVSPRAPGLRHHADRPQRERQRRDAGRLGRGHAGL